MAARPSRVAARFDFEPAPGPALPCAGAGKSRVETPFLSAGEAASGGR
jgi:hypothetical protein